jgi:hypothetical protein
MFNRFFVFKIMKKKKIKNLDYWLFFFQKINNQNLSSAPWKNEKKYFCFFFFFQKNKIIETCHLPHEKNFYFIFFFLKFYYIFKSIWLQKRSAILFIKNMIHYFMHKPTEFIRVLHQKWSIVNSLIF